MPLQHERPILDVGQQQWSDPIVVPNQVAFGEGIAGPHEQFRMGEGLLGSWEWRVPPVGSCGSRRARQYGKGFPKHEALLIGDARLCSTVPESPTIAATFPNRDVGHFLAQLLHMGNIVVSHKRVEHFPPDLRVGCSSDSSP